MTAYNYHGARIITRDFTANYCGFRVTASVPLTDAAARDAVWECITARKRRAPRCMWGDAAIITGGYAPDTDGGRYVYDVLYAC